MVPSDTGNATNLNAMNERNPNATVFKAQTARWSKPILSAKMAWETVEMMSKVVYTIIVRVRLLPYGEVERNVNHLCMEWEIIELMRYETDQALAARYSISPAME
jgi:uncharacterized protein with PIN domain